jgi:hypothetical protein
VDLGWIVHDFQSLTLKTDASLISSLRIDGTKLTALFLYCWFAQSSALGFLLAQKHFSNPLVAVPSAVSVVCMAVSFLLLALDI